MSEQDLSTSETHHRDEVGRSVDRSPDLPIVCERLGLGLVVLFGSRATGRARADSDLDLAVLGGGLGTPEGFWRCYHELAPVFDGVELDLVSLHDADPLLRYEVMRKGKLLFGDVDRFLEYRAFAFRDYVDSADLRELERTLFRKKMAFLHGELHGAA
jgi:uncharacterized protein